MKKVAVIGASVAGLSTGLELLQLNPDLHVVVYELKRFVGERTVCGGAVSLYMMGKVGLKVPANCVAARIRRARIYAPNGAFWEGGGEGEYGYILWREAWERRMAEEFQSLGGELRLESRVGVEDFPWLRKEFDVVVGADGLLGVTRRFLGLTFPARDDVHACVQRIASMDHPSDRVDLYFGSAISKGYGWIFPEGPRRHVRIGLGVPMGLSNPKALLDHFIARMGAKSIFLHGAKLLPTAPPPKTGVYGNVVLVGDAAPWCDPLTGGGICQAVASGKACARVIAEGKLEKYDSNTAWLRRQNAIRYRLKKVLYDLSDPDLNEMIETMRDFKPSLTRISWAIAHALVVLALKKPRLLVRHKALRRLFLRDLTS